MLVLAVASLVLVFAVALGGVVVLPVVLAVASLGVGPLDLRTQAAQPSGRAW